MKLLLRKNISKLGIIGDIVEVSDGYGRNYLLPYGLATEPNETNIRALADARRQAEHERAEQRAAMQASADRLEGIEVMIAARANEEGILYGSVGPREIAEALNAEGHEVTPDHIDLKDPIRRLDNVAVPVRLAEDLAATVKVWVVREQPPKEGDESSEEGAGSTEASSDDDSSGGTA